ITVILKNVERDQEDYETEICRLEARVLFFATQQERLREYSAQIKALTSPIRKLPNELLGRIFDECCEMNHFSVKQLPVKTACSIRAAPAMAVSSVCARWRRIALSLPAIWSRICLLWDVKAGRAYPEPEYEKSHFPTTIFLTRSLAHPLDV
ncbi:hypothetical protein GYMLUDRAFT_106225, partial [Collybiopsis luxurians FD-317 M1]